MFRRELIKDSRANYSFCFDQFSASLTIQSIFSYFITLSIPLFLIIINTRTSLPPASLLHRSGVKDLSATFIADHSFSLNNCLCGIFFLSIFWLRLDTFVCFSLQDVQLAKSYDKEPTIMITANHDSKGNNLEPKYISVTAWIEVFYQFSFIISS